jgi:hypothetical protein
VGLEPVVAPLFSVHPRLDAAAVAAVGAVMLTSANARAWRATP